MEEVLDSLLARDMEIQSLKDLIKDMAEDYRELKQELKDREESYAIAFAEEARAKNILEEIKDMVFST